MTRRYRMTFLMQQVLGHRTHSAALAKSVMADAEIDPLWVPITYHREDGWIERAPGLPAGVKGVARAATEVHRALAAAPADVILFNSPALATTAGTRIARTPAVISLDVTPRQFDREGRHFGHRPDAGSMADLKHRWNRRLFSRVAAFAPWSQWAARSLVDDYGVERSRIHVISPGVDIAAWTAPERADSVRPRVLFVGTDFIRKGGDLVVGWYRSRGHMLCELHIVSADPRARAAAGDGVVVHADLTPDDDRLRRLYWSSDVFVMPSRSEPFGIAAIEALAAALPVVVSSVGGLADIVDHGASGILVEPENVGDLDAALTRLLSSRSLRNQMSRAARETAQGSYDASVNNRRLIDLLKASAVKRAASVSPLAGEVVAR